VSAFDPAVRLTPADLLDIRRRPGSDWAPLPARPDRPDRLHQILLELPEDTPEAIVEQGGEGIGEEVPRPSAAGPVSTAAGAVVKVAGGGLHWLGSKLGWRGMAKLGAKLLSSAANMAPRITESLLGQQEAALRALLRAFREGNLEAALRRALPLGGLERGGGVAAGAQLPDRDPRYSLSNLLGRGGIGSVWLGGGDVQAELAAEYRKAAEAASARGDFRRAAYIYAKLLNDFRLAAAALESGGLHHDAARIYLEKLADHLAAARAFEAAGEIDQALSLFRARRDHARAGDMLRRAGDVEAALIEYQLAAEALAKPPLPDFFAAAELLRARADRPDLALPFYLEGWSRRPAAIATNCLGRIMEHYARTDATALLAVIAEGEAYFAEGAEPAGVASFFESVVRLADQDHLASCRADLRDRALCGLAGQLRRRVAEEKYAGNLVSTYFGRSGQWTASQVSDAEFAVRAKLVRKPALPASPVQKLNVTRLRPHVGKVTAACAASESGVMYLSFEDGRVVRYDPRNDVVDWVPPCSATNPPAAALSTDNTGNQLVVLWQPKYTEAHISPSALSGTTVVLSGTHSHSSDATPWGCIGRDANGRSIQSSIRTEAVADRAVRGFVG
jgi:tetratricopeptide (TPR) repeat protein